MPVHPPLEDVLRDARSQVVPYDELSKSNKIRRRLFMGETVTRAKVAAELGSTEAAALSVVVKELEALGYKIDDSERDYDGGSNRAKKYRLTNPAFIPAQSVFDRLREDRRNRDKQKRVDKAKARPEPEAPSVEVVVPPAPKKRRLPMPTIPALGQNLEVFLAMVDDEGIVHVGLRQNGTRWVCAIEEQTEVRS